MTATTIRRTSGSIIIGLGILASAAQVAAGDHEDLDAAYNRLMSGVSQARAMGARTILLVTGKPRPVDPADRGHKRGAIRAKVLDWLAASSHHSAIAAVRRAHIRHGGEGALYIVLRRER